MYEDLVPRDALHQLHLQLVNMEVRTGTILTEVHSKEQLNKVLALYC